MSYKIPIRGETSGACETLTTDDGRRWAPLDVEQDELVRRLELRAIDAEANAANANRLIRGLDRIHAERGRAVQDLEAEIVKLNRELQRRGEPGWATSPGAGTLALRPAEPGDVLFNACPRRPMMGGKAWPCRRPSGHEGECRPGADAREATPSEAETILAARAQLDRYAHDFGYPPADAGPTPAQVEAEVAKAAVSTAVRRRESTFGIIRRQANELERLRNGDAVIPEPEAREFKVRGYHHLGPAPPHVGAIVDYGPDPIEPGDV